MWGREIEEQMQIVARNDICRVFSASYVPRYAYPYKLAHTEKIYPAHADSCYELIIDSAFKDQTITNERVLEQARKHNADYIIPKDFVGQPERTRESTAEFLELYEGADGVHGTVVPVIQPDHLTHLREHQDFYDQFSHLGIGGLLKFNPAERITILKQIREEVGHSKYLHAFGVGTSLPMIKALREYPHLLNSLDVSTAESCIRNGKILDRKMDQFTFYTPGGTDATTVKAHFSKAVLLMINYLLSDKVDEHRIEADYAETELGPVDDVIESTEVRSRHELDFGTMSEPDGPDSATATTLTSFK